MKFSRMITTVDTHTEGEPTRVIVVAFPHSLGETS